MPKFWVIDTEMASEWEEAEEVEATDAREATRIVGGGGLDLGARDQGHAETLFYVADNARGIGAKAYRWAVEVKWNYDFWEDHLANPPAPLEEDPE